MGQMERIEVKGNKVVVNLSSKSLDEATQTILARGLNFAIAPELFRLKISFVA